VLDLPGNKPMPREVAMPKLPAFHARDNKRADLGGKDLRAGFSFDFWLQLDSLTAGQILLDNRDNQGKGILVATTETGTIQITLNDGRQESSWDCDRGLIKPGRLHHVVITADGGPKIITFVMDGLLCDGGDQRQFGWGRFSPTLLTPKGSPTLKIAPGIRSLHVYNRPLRTSEAVGNFRAGI
jgi:Concanavalin A-like lectin/glucanases superfamily